MELGLKTAVGDAQQLRQLASLFVEEFRNRSGAGSRPVVNLLFHEQRAEPDAAPRKSSAEPIEAKIENGQLLIHFYEKALEGIPVLALQGWLDWELGRFLLTLEPQRFHYKFSKLILPLFPVTGSAVNILRDFVNRLETGLKSYLITKLAINADHAAAQFYYHFFRFQPDTAEADDYRLFAPHGWSRLLFLVDKLKEFIPVCLLEKQGISPHLKSSWWSFYEFLAKEDRLMMEELAEIPARLNEEPYPVQLVEMFKASRFRYGGPIIRN